MLSLACISVAGCDPAAPVPPAAAPLASSVGVVTSGPAPSGERGAPTAAAKKTARSWNFDSDALGAGPSDFGAEVGKWHVVADDSAPSGDKTFAQLAISDDDVFNVALVAGTARADVDLSVKLRAVAGRVDQGGGVVWRARDARNYYIARYNPLEDNYRVYLVEDGRRKMLQSAKLQVAHGAWHRLRVTMVGDQITCSLDGTKHLEAHDTTFGQAGRIGLWTKADAITHFDDLAVSAPR